MKGWLKKIFVGQAVITTVLGGLMVGYDFLWLSQVHDICVLRLVCGGSCAVYSCMYMRCTSDLLRTIPKLPAKDRLRPLTQGG